MQAQQTQTRGETNSYNFQTQRGGWASVNNGKPLIELYTVKWHTQTERSPQTVMAIPAPASRGLAKSAWLVVVASNLSHELARAEWNADMGFVNIRPSAIQQATEPHLTDDWARKAFVEARDVLTELRVVILTLGEHVPSAASSAKNLGPFRAWLPSAHFVTAMSLHEAMVRRAEEMHEHTTEILAWLKGRPQESPMFKLGIDYRLVELRRLQAELQTNDNILRGMGLVLNQQAVDQAAAIEAGKVEARKGRDGAEC